MKIQMHKPATKSVRVGDERQMAYCEYGDPLGKPVFYFHGTPGSRYEPSFGDQAGKDYGYRIIALDRPGIGRSDYVKARRLLDWPQDVKAVAKQLGVRKFGVIGASGGGAYALACSYAIPEQLEFSVVMGSWGPVATEPKLREEMAPLDRFFAQLSNSVPWVFYVPFSLLGYAAKRMSPQEFMKVIESSMSVADKQLIANEAVAQFYADDIAEGFRQGVRGPADDAIILYGEWGFDVAEIAVEVHLFHGKEDRFAPYSYAVYFDDTIPTTRLYGYPREGHLFIAQLFNEVFKQISL
ncbi:MAG: alpha/beta hydrolase [Cyanobacteria bacterium P01_D01_bin.115]